MVSFRQCVGLAALCLTWTLVHARAVVPIEWEDVNDDFGTDDADYPQYGLETVGGADLEVDWNRGRIDDDDSDYDATTGLTGIEAGDLNLTPASHAHLQGCPLRITGNPSMSP